MRAWRLPRRGEPVDIELVLAVDVSISVDGSELDLQRQGFAAAFRDPAVIDAIRANAQGVAVCCGALGGIGPAAHRGRLAASDGRGLDPGLRDDDRPGAAVDPEFQGKTAIGNALYFAP